MTEYTYGKVESKEVWERLESMSKDELLELDPICHKINEIIGPKPIKPMANRLVALVVRDILDDWYREVMERE